MKQTEFKRHVKLVCTIGPASNSPKVIENMLKGGMDIGRFNLAHGTLDQHRQLISEIHSLSRKLKRPTGILIDLPGTKYHAGDVRTVFSKHLEFARSVDADFIALSFISSLEQLVDVKELIKEMRVDIPIIVKIEQAQALKESSLILEACEGIMIARGDLALKISIEKVPLAQKKLIKEANRHGKPVITATQMLESMVYSDTPTRAEATDVANAVLDGSDALMLSEETAMGNYPAEATKMMAKISLEAESAFPYEQTLHEGWQNVSHEINDATARAACQMAHQVRARAIIAFTTGGTTALRVSRYRPHQPILAVTPSETVVRRLSLPWGVTAVRKPPPPNLEALLVLARKVALETQAAKPGDLVVVTAGIPLAAPGSTNLVKVHVI